MRENLTTGKIYIIEWMLGLVEQKSTKTRMISRLEAHVEGGVLLDKGDYYELSEKWLNRYVFTSSKRAIIPNKLRQLGGVLDHPTNAKHRLGWKFSSVFQAEVAVSLLGSWGIKANRYGTLITSLDY